MELIEAIKIAKNKRHESYDSLIPKINEVLVPLGFTLIKHRQEVHQIVKNGYSDSISSKNNLVIDILLDVLEINKEEV